MVLLAALVEEARTAAEEVRTAADEVVALLEEDWAIALVAARMTMMLEICILNMNVDDKVGDWMLVRLRY